MAKKQNKGVHEIDPNALNTYFLKRMFALGIKNTKEYFYIIDGDFPSPDYKQPIFTETDKGDIQISYPSLYGGPEIWMNGGRETVFFRLRHNPENEQNNGYRYFQEPKSGTHIFHTPAILTAFKDKVQFETLYLVEGEFKAFAGSLAGLMICGIGGKDSFKDGEKDAFALHPDIIAIIQTCGIKNLVLLLDADIITLKWDPEEDPHKDLARRNSDFFNGVKTFREMAKGQVRDAYFAHVKTTYEHEAKGLDDLLLLEAERKDKVIEDLEKLTASRVFFDCKNLSSEGVSKLRAYFLLTRNAKNVPNTFYAWYEDQIKNLEFNFMGSRYIKLPGEDLKLVKHEDSFRFIRVACDYFKLIDVPNTNKEGVLDRKRVPWKSGEITRDYIYQQGHKNFFDTIDRFDAFCNVPCNTAKYQDKISGCFNMYYKIEHEPITGQWPKTESYLKHVFGTAVLSSGFTNYELALDYLTLLYLKPTQKLPIICLVNKEKNTGKSTFLWLMKEIFQGNCTFIGNEELKDHLNDDWASKLIIGVDEGFIDKKSVLERLKSMSTSSTIKLRGMYAGRQEIPFFGKFMLTSNDEDNFVSIDSDETRFWVNKVPVLTKDDPDIVAKMTDEIPAFLHFLAERKILHPKIGRHWFDHKLLETEALKRVKQSSRSWFEQEIREILTELFFEYEYHTLYFTIGEIVEKVNSPNSGIKYRKADIAKQLKDKFNLESRLMRYEFPLKVTGEISPFRTEQKRGRVFEFHVENILKPDQLEQFNQFYKPIEIIDFRSKMAEIDQTEPEKAIGF